MIKRQEVYRLIDGERAYQQAQGKPDERELHHWVKSIQYYATRAWNEAGWSHDRAALVDIRKVAALCVAALEQYGCPPREGYVQLQSAVQPSTSELLPCPFCGNDYPATVASMMNLEPVAYHVCCLECNAESAMAKTEAEAIEAWNRRTPPSAPAQPLDMPDWSKAPEWAQWWAVDANGAGWWYEYKPGESKDDWFSGRGNRMRSATPFVDWRATLRQRPDASAPEA